MSTSNLTWSIQEKERMCKLLELYPYNAVPILAKKIGTKSEEEVEEYIQKMINSIIRNEESYKTKKVALHRAPLEEWADISSDLVSFEHTDFSQNLAKVFNVIALYEDQKDEKVNYRAIYRFLSQCMQMGRQDDLESLGPIECSILVDLMHSLMDVLSQHDVYVQANILKWKHMLLEYRDSYCNPDPRLLRMASENDFDDFIDGLFDEHGQFRMQPGYIPELGNVALRQAFKSMKEGEIFKKAPSKDASGKPKTTETSTGGRNAQEKGDIFKKAPSKDASDKTKTTETSTTGTYAQEKGEIFKKAPSKDASDKTKTTETSTTGTYAQEKGEIFKKAPSKDASDKTKTTETSTTGTYAQEKGEMNETEAEEVSKRAGGWKRRHPLSKKDEENATVVRVGLANQDVTSSSKNLTYTMEREQIKSRSCIQPRDAKQTTESVRSGQKSSQSHAQASRTISSTIDCSASNQAPPVEINDEEIIKEKHQQLNQLFAKFTPKTANMAPSMVSLCPASEVKKHKAGAKKRFPKPEELETPKTEIILVMPPKGVPIKNYTVQSKTRKKFETVIDEEDLTILEEKEEREYYYEVKTCELDQFYNKKRKVEQSPAEIVPAVKAKIDNFNQQADSKIAAKKRLDLARKRKLEAVKRAVKDRQAPVKKSKTYSLNPFCLPLMLVDLDQ
ncbi:uncharacterized protein LOC128235384 [Mya arenaria]|uniref:uncharacterized protein LOC128235384 n=1 Tax=Mya arenaria TaxID=6604 RepID=UPI0022E0D43A|nr:uncharacterized protein LOC128235384 [Mya arenaria]